MSRQDSGKTEVTEDDFQNFVAKWQATVAVDESEREAMVAALPLAVLVVLQYTTASMESIPRS